ncbi:MAG: hypothetical protein ACXWZ5_20655 [Mycobacterium sp.]
MTTSKLLSVGRAPLVIFAIALAAVTGLAVPGAAGAAQPPITFGLTLGVLTNCISGEASGGSTIDIVWRDSSGALQGQGSAAVTEWGSWSVCGLDDEAHVIQPGDRIKATVGTYTRKYVVPNLSATVDRVNDIYTGTGPAGRTIRIWYQAGLLADYEEGHSIRVGQDGHWTYDPHPYQDLIRSVSVYWTSPNGDTLSIYGAAPELGVTIGSARVTGVAEAFATVGIAIANSPVASGNDVADDWGNFNVRLRRQNGNPRQIVAGDHLVAPDVAADADWIVPDSYASADVASDQVTGWCEDTGLLTEIAIVEVHRTGRTRGLAWLTGVDAAGQFSVDFTGREYPGFNPANIKHGDRLVVSCMLSTGDWVNQSFMVP